jgi:Holliday junction resolvasome RuvABC endonuclease subunit
VKLLLGLDAIPKPHDATDALAVAICHLHNGSALAKTAAVKKSPGIKSWRQYRP